VTVHHSTCVLIHDRQHHHARLGKAIDQALKLQQGLLGAIASYSEIRHWDLEDALERCRKALTVGDPITMRVGIARNQDDCIASWSDAIHAKTILVVGVGYLHV